MKNIASIATQVMPPPIHEDRVWKQEGNTGDIVEAILSAEQWNQDQTAALAQHLKGGSPRETLRNVWFFVRNYIKYRKDLPGYERVKLPSKTWADREGDCKSMSVFIAGLLKNLDIPAKYRFVSYRKGEPVSHVYVVAMPKGERQVIMDAVHSKFDNEVPYKSKKEYPVMTKIAVVHGLPKGQNGSKSVAIPKGQFVPFSQLSEGEARMMLMDRQLQILSLIDSQNSDQYNGARQIVNSVLEADLHSLAPNQITGIGSGNGHYVEKVSRIVANASRLTMPAMLPKPPSIGFLKNGFNLPSEERLKFIQYYNEQYEKLTREYLDCKNRVRKANWIKSEFTKDLLVKQGCAPQIRARELLEYEKAINDRFEAGGYSLLYMFAPSTDGNRFANVAAKRLRYSEARAGLSGLTGISKDNLSTMAANGILAAGPNLAPDKAYLTLRDGSAPAVGEPITIAVITGIIIAIGGAVKALADLLGKVSPEDKVAYSLPQSWDESLAPDQEDFIGGASSTTASTNWLIMALIGGGLLWGAKAVK